jgi:hypothetical protein
MQNDDPFEALQRLWSAVCAYPLKEWPINDVCAVDRRICEIALLLPPPTTEVGRRCLAGAMEVLGLDDDEAEQAAA